MKVVKGPCTGLFLSQQQRRAGLVGLDLIAVILPEIVEPQLAIAVRIQRFKRQKDEATAQRADWTAYRLHKLWNRDCSITILVNSGHQDALVVLRDVHLVLLGSVGIVCTHTTRARSQEHLQAPASLHGRLGSSTRSAGMHVCLNGTLNEQACVQSSMRSSRMHMCLLYSKYFVSVGMCTSHYPELFEALCKLSCIQSRILVGVHILKY